MHPLARAALGVTAAGVVGVGYASVVERNLFVLRRHTVPVLAPGSRSLRVLHLTDLHLMPTQERKIAWHDLVGAGGRPEISPRLEEGEAAYLEVSAGLGTSPMAPVRFACRPEASLLTLVPRDA